MVFTDTAFFHVPLQSFFAYMGFNQLGRQRYFLSRLTGTLLATFAAIDFARGLATDFAHLRTGSVPNDYATFVAEMLKAYLFVNVMYVSRCCSGTLDNFCIVKDCTAPLLLATVIQLAQETASLNTLRPFLIGIIPNVVAAYKGTRQLNPHLVLWFRVAFPLYSLRYLTGNERAFQLMLGWFVYHAIYFGIFLSCGSYA
jgi:hypothetical protein